RCASWRRCRSICTRGCGCADGTATTKPQARRRPDRGGAGYSVAKRLEWPQPQTLQAFSLCWARPLANPSERHQELQMALRVSAKTKSTTDEPIEAAPEPASQRTRSEARYRVQVDRQTKRSFTSMEAAEEMAAAIKRAHT